jgi:hypothetical protein
MEDRRQHPYSPNALDTQLGSEAASIVDVRRDALMADALGRSPNDVERRRNALPSGRRVVRQVVTTCFHGRELNEGVEAAFRIMGIEVPLP